MIYLARPGIKKEYNQATLDTLEYEWITVTLVQKDSTKSIFDILYNSKTKKCKDIKKIKNK